MAPSAGAAYGVPSVAATSDRLPPTSIPSAVPACTGSTPPPGSGGSTPAARGDATTRSRASRAKSGNSGVWGCGPWKATTPARSAPRWSAVLSLKPISAFGRAASARQSSASRMRMVP